MAKPKLLSLHPQDAEQGGLFQGRAKVLVSKAVRWDYGGGQVEVPALYLKLKPKAGGDPIEQYLSCGSLDRIRPTKDGTGFVPSPDSPAKGISASSNTYIFLSSLADHGFPKKLLLGGRVDGIKGLDAMFVRIPQPRRAGLAEPEAGEGGQVRAKTVMVVDVIYANPDGSKPGKAKAEDADEDEDTDTEEDSGSDEEEEEEDETEDADEDESEDEEEEESDDEDESESEDEEEESDEEEEEEDEEEEEAPVAKNPITSAAKKAVIKILAANKKGISKDALYKKVHAAVRDDKNARKILATVQDAKFLASVASYNKKTQLVTAK